MSLFEDFYAFALGTGYSRDTPFVGPLCYVQCRQAQYQKKRWSAWDSTFALNVEQAACAGFVGCVPWRCGEASLCVIPARSTTWCPVTSRRMHVAAEESLIAYPCTDR